MPKLFFLFIFFSSFCLAKANQDSTITSLEKTPVGISMRTHLGGIYKHTPAYSKLGELNNTYAAEICAILPKRGTHNWHHAFNYPEVMFSLLYTDFGSIYLGKSISALANIQLDALKTDAYSLYIRMGAGAAFITERFDSVSNPQNEIIGSHLNDINKIGIGININFLENWRFSGGFSITHFSNGSVKKPNRGINLRSVELGLSYIPTYQKIELPAYTCNKKRKIGLLFKAGWGLTNQYEYPNKIFEVWSASLISSIFTGKYNSIQLGIGAEYNWYLHRLLNDNKVDFASINKEQISLIIGDELLFGKTGISYQMHRVINNAMQNEFWRTRLGLNYYFTDIDLKRCGRSFLGVGLISHKFTALYAEVCAGFVF
jgi:opacity protein-like surface antigen